eukprot:2189971-Pyramimonas_sp.AAC.1
MAREGDGGMWRALALETHQTSARRSHDVSEKESRYHSCMFADYLLLCDGGTRCRHVIVQMSSFSTEEKSERGRRK